MIDETKIPVIDAAVLLLNANYSSQVKADTTDEKDAFSFTKAKTEIPLLQQNMLGFSPHWSDVMQTAQLNKLELTIAIFASNRVSNYVDR